MSGEEFFNSLISSKFEIAPALAKFNFDFALWKVEAPPEYRGVGASLSQKRREDAEDGRTHITARKLGALFEEIIPETPALFRAYGQRASEIMGSTTFGDCTRQSYGAFANSVGIDATTLWAAATSGKEAIAVHLLACMLARAWDGPRATSIWVEIVEERRSMIHAKFEENNKGMGASLMAAKQEITREQLREWDSSARAWLYAADSAKAASQKQLMLIINNLELSVNNKPEVYGSVIEAWTSSLEQMEHLVNGKGQTPRSGSIILALSAWHVYPNLSVLKPVVKDVLLSDSLVPSVGVLTIGMDPSTRLSETNGISWSLPLSHLRQYGKPVQSKSSVGIASSTRLTLDEFMTAILGCFLTSWGVATKDCGRVIEWLLWLSQLLENAASSGNRQAKAMLSHENNVSWLSLVLNAAKLYRARDDRGDHFSWKLLLIGMKYGQNFIGQALEPFFGLGTMGRIVRCLKGEEERIAYLRLLAQEYSDDYGIGPDLFLIRYVSENVAEFASAIPCMPLLKKSHDGQTTLSHFRYIISTSGHHHQEEANGTNAGSKGIVEPTPAKFGHLRLSSSTPLPITSHPPIPEDLPRTGHLPIRAWNLEQCLSRQKRLKATGEIVNILPTGVISNYDPQSGLRVLSPLAPPMREGTAYHLVHGDVNTAGLYCIANYRTDAIIANNPREASWRMSSFVGDSKISSQRGPVFEYSLQKALQKIFLLAHDKLDTNELILNLYDHFFDHESKVKYESLRVIATVAQLYENMPLATLDVRVLQRNLNTAEFSTSMQSDILKRDPESFLLPLCLRPYLLTRQVAFSLILMFETGVFVIHSKELHDVFAVSTTNSLFVGSALLQDPSIRNEFDVIRHIPGNIGHSGVSLLVPPKDPMIKEYDLADWRESGSLDKTRIGKDCFQNTTLHLSFTGVELPLNVNFTGGQDHEVYLLETLVGVYDRGYWIADLDVYEGLLGRDTLILEPVFRCKRHGDSKVDHFDHQGTSLDTWTSILDATESHLNVVCARGNWQARLAATVVCEKLNYHTWVAPAGQSFCWKCVEEHEDEALSRRKKVVVID